jgi:hypothetical protein
MSIISAIHAEHHLEIIERAIALAKKKYKPSLSPHEKVIVGKVLKDVRDYCVRNIQE